MPALRGLLRRGANTLVLAGLVTLLLVGHLLLRSPRSPRSEPSQGDSLHVPDTTDRNHASDQGATSANAAISASLPCQGLSGADDVQVVMRTGATEIKDKLPVHFDTTFRCYQNLLIFSDYHEFMSGHEIHDALENIDEDLKLSNGDFGLYLRLRSDGRAALDQHELSGTAAFESGPKGRKENAGWRLDKWKFLPMAQRTLEMRPDKKWFVFVESDTYLVWSNLLQWLQDVDSQQPSYYGSEISHGQDIFAHGGSGFVVSKSALEKAVEAYTSDPAKWHAVTADHWAGDYVFGMALRQAGVGLTWAWPMFQGGNPATMDWKEDKLDDRRLWCSPALSYHHLSPWEIEQTWQFEQRWIEESNKPESFWSWTFGDNHGSRLRHQDLFQKYALPNMSAPRQDWQNGSPLIEEGTQGASIEGCRDTCEADHDCVQYTLDHQGCWLGYDAKLGQAFTGVQSGWIPDRVKKWIAERGKCQSRRDWTAP